MSQTIETTSFDYSQVHQGARNDIKKRAAEVRKLFADTENNIRAIGEKLMDAKDRLPHGQFEAWIAHELPQIGRTSAYKFMQIAAFKSSAAEYLTMPQDVVAALASPSVPDAARAEIVDNYRLGTPNKLPEVKEIINRHKGIAPVTPEEKRERIETAARERETRRQQKEIESRERNLEKERQRQNREAERLRQQQLAALENTDAIPDEIVLPEMQFVAATQSADERAEECVAACEGVEFVGFPGKMLNRFADALRGVDPANPLFTEIDW